MQHRGPAGARGGDPHNTPVGMVAGMQAGVLPQSTRTRNLDPKRSGANLSRIQLMAQPQGQGSLDFHALRVRDAHIIRHPEVHGRRVLQGGLWRGPVHPYGTVLLRLVIGVGIHVDRALVRAQSQIYGGVVRRGRVHVDGGLGIPHLPVQAEVGRRRALPVHSEIGRRVSAEAELRWHGTWGVRAEAEGGDGVGGTGAEA